MNPVEDEEELSKAAILITSNDYSHASEVSLDSYPEIGEEIEELAERQEELHRDAAILFEKIADLINEEK